MTSNSPPTFPKNMHPHGPLDSAVPPISPPQPQRPRFLRAITSPLPALTAFAAQIAGDGSATAPHPNGSDMCYSSGTDPRNDDPDSQDALKKPHSRPRLQPLQLQNDQHHSQSQPSATPDPSLRSFSSSILSTLFSSNSSLTNGPASPTSPTHPRSSIADALLKDRRRSNGQTLNWMPNFTRGHHAEGLDAHPNSVAASQASSRSPKSAQKPMLDSSGHQLAAYYQDSEHSGGCASLGLDTVSVSGNLSNGLSASESSMYHLKGDEARTRRTSESGQNLLSISKQPGPGLGKRLSGFAQSMRTRPPFSGTNPTPPPSIDSSASRPNLSKHRAQSGDAILYSAHESQKGTDRNPGFGSWDDFLKAYSEGRFPNVQLPPQTQKRHGIEFPPFPDYAKPNDIANPPPFLAAPSPPTEEKRLKALYSFQILETGSDMNFQRVAQLVATVLNVSGCMICLVDQSQVTIKANHRAENMECSREVSLSGHAILRPAGDPLVVLDASEDWRFRNLPAVTGGPRVRFYAGAALATSDGLNIGSLCVIDPKPRTEFSEREKMLLVDFAAVVMREMELWNDQVQLCTRTRMMRDITRWVRGRLDVNAKESALSSKLSTNSKTDEHSSDQAQPTIPPTSLEAAIPGSTSTDLDKPTTQPSDAAFPTPTGSPTPGSSAVENKSGSRTEVEGVRDHLEDVAFPSACGMIQTTMNVDAVYLIQAAVHKSFIQLNDSNVVWNYLGNGDRSKGCVGTIGGGELLQSPGRMELNCLASSKRFAKANSALFDESAHQVRRQGSAWVCTDEGCRPHRLGDMLLDAVEPEWTRDLPVISEMLSYVRQEKIAPDQYPLFTYSLASEENDFSEPWANESTPKPSKRNALLCHTFQGTLPLLSAGASSPYKSGIVMPIRGASSGNRSSVQEEEPWAYFVVLSSSRTKQFSIHERIYLKNFGSCLITEVLKRRVEAADKAKGVFIKSISHELRTPLHIILGILELLYTSSEETLSEHQLSMIASAEASGKGLIDTINNIIDLADLDPDNNADSENFQRAQCPLPELYTHVAEIDIRELCEQVAGTMTKSCIDKNLVIVPTWTKPSLVSLSSSMTNSTPNSSSGANVRAATPVQDYASSRQSMDETSHENSPSPDSYFGQTGSKHSSDQKAGLELIVAMDEPDRDPEEDAHWNFLLNLPVIKRILTQLLENALKFTTTGFVEISAVSPPMSSLPLRPPQPELRPILFTVRDTGKGISPEFAQLHLFQRFSQEDPLQVGTGLGLALVKLLVESLGGWLEIYSEGIEGKGCVVRVLVWATPATNETKSLKDEQGAWQEKSCRFYTGESALSTDRLWKIMGERMIAQDLNMNVERGNEQDISPEDMLRDLNDQSPCDLLIFNDDLARLKAYLSYWTDEHQKAMGQDIDSSKVPTPLLMLISIWKHKKAQALIDAYVESWRERGGSDRAATVVLMPKPFGPLKLLGCLRSCFATNDDARSLHDHPELTDKTEDGAMMTQPSMMPLMRSATVPHITTMAMGVQDNRMLSAGIMIKSSFKFPASPAPLTELGSAPVPPHSPGGLVIGPKDPPTVLSDSDSQSSLSDGSVTAPRTDRDPSVIKPKTQRSIRKFMSHRSGSARAMGKKSSLNEVETINSGKSTVVLGEPLVSEGSDQLGMLKPVPRVLIVEDNMTNRMILRTFLKKRGVSVVEAENGKLGVERFQEEVWRRQGRSGFEFVLMDLQMPIMDGHLATKRIREFEHSMAKQHGLSTPEVSDISEMDKLSEAQDIPEFEKRGYRPTTIFALTGLAGEEDKRLAFESGVDGYLTKPVSLKTLGALLSSCHPSYEECLN